MTVGYPNPDEWATGRLSAAPRLTVLTSKSGPLTKSYEATENGGVRRVSAPLSVSNGVAQVAELQAATAGAALEKLRQGVSKFTGSMALMTGCPVGAGKEWEIVPKSEEDIAQRKISRSKDCFRGVEGPALLALDFDIKEFPEHIREKLRVAGGLEAVMASVFPSIGTAARLILPSASSYIRNSASGQCTGQAGEHWYFVVSDGRKTSALADLIADHLEANGWCWGHVTKNGNVIVKTLIDRAATAPERIMYEAAPVLGPGLENNPEKAPRLIEGGVLDAESIAPIDAALRALQEQHRQAEKARVAQEAAKRRKEWKAERVSDLIERGVEPEKARRTADAAAGCELTGDFLITFDDGTSSTVREILADPEVYDKRKGPDPIEPEYGGGKNIAVLQTGYPAQIYSQAHGGTIYRLVDDPADYFEPMEFEASPPPKNKDDAEQTTTVDKPRRGFSLLDADDLESRPPQWLVRGVIETDSLALLFGASGCGKSFVAVDLALSVATGVSFHGRPVRQGPVVYIAGEGRNGLGRRFDAWSQHKGVSRSGAPIAVSKSAAKFLHAENARDVEAAVDEFAVRRGAPALIVVDTLARNFGPGDENGTQDMSRFIDAVDALRLRYPGCTVLVVHHVGLTDKHRPRGNGALTGGVDIEYRLERSNSTLTMSNLKMKDGPEPAPIAFETVTVELGNEEDGQPFGSLALNEVAPRPKAEGKKLTGNAETGLKAFRAARDKLSPDDPRAAVSLDLWRDEFYRVSTADGGEAKKKAFQRARNELTRAGYLDVSDDSYTEAWPPE